MTASAGDGYDFFAPDPRVGGPAAEVPSASSHAPGRFGVAPTASLPPGAPLPKPSRWAKSDTTFGPVGRIVATVGMFIPFVFFVGTGLLTFDPFVLVGALIWGALMVMGLRQVWQPVHHRHRR